MGDVDEGGPQPLVQLGQLGASLHAQLGVKVGQRLIEEEYRRVTYDGAAERHPLSLPAG